MHPLVAKEPDPENNDPHRPVDDHGDPDAHDPHVEVDDEQVAEGDAEKAITQLKEGLKK